MAERRYPLSVVDESGVRHEGELIVASRWRASLAPSAGADFAVILTEAPIEPRAPTPEPGVIVCAPAEPVRLLPAVAEGRVSYDDATPAAPLRLPKPARAAYAAGALLATMPLATTVRDVFERGEPRLDLLAHEALAQAASVQRYWETLDAILAWPDAPSRRPRAGRTRERLRAALAAAPPFDRRAPSGSALERLQRIAAGEAPVHVAASPAQVREDAACLRCLIERPDDTRELAAMRAYVDDAVPRAAEQLLSDHTFVREQLSFATLLSEPHQLPALRATFAHFRDQHAGAYARHHAAYWSAWERLLAELRDAAPAADALTRLNTLAALGRPAGEEALASYRALLRDRAVCSRPDLAVTLRERPRCPDCAISLADAAPVDTAAEAQRGVRRALRRQQARLASEVVRRLLARGGERLDRFLQIVQASDLAGLADILDDELLAFLRELLAEPTARQVPAEQPTP